MATSAAALDYRPSYLAAAVASAVVLLLYVVTLAPSTAMWDTSEYIAAAYTLGIPHPPGNPLFVLIGRVFTLLPIAPSVAARVNVLAAVCSAVTAGLWFLITERVLVGWLRARWQRIAGGALAALVGATAFTVWSQSVVNEKVYTVSLVGLALVAWLVVRWCDEPDAPGSDKLLVLACFVMGLGYANHMAGVLTLPAMLVAVALRRPQTFLKWRLLLAGAGALVLGASPFATQPIRAAHFPAVNEGEPTGCVDQISASCTFSAKTVDRFMYNFNREQYAKPPVTERQAPFGAQIGTYWLYFTWQWVRDADGRSPGLQGALAFVFLALGLLGAWVHYARDRLSFAFFGPLMVTLTLLLIYYLNFRYGHSQAPDLGDAVDREVRDRDYFFLWSFSAWSVWVALGLMYVWESLAALLGTEANASAEPMPRPGNWAIASPVLALAFVPLFANWGSASRAGETDTADWARDLLNSVEPYGILVTVGDNDTFPLWYAQEVEGVRRDVLIANTSLMNTDWFVRQMIRRPVMEYDSARGPSVYRDRTWTKPSGPPFKITYDEADSIPLLDYLAQPMVFVAQGIRAEVQAGRLERADRLVYQLVLDNPDRTIHFSRSASEYPNLLGFGDRLIGHGLTRKLSRDSIVASDRVMNVMGEGLPGRPGWIDITASKGLWDEFDAPESLIRKDKWIDRPSVGIPYLYLTLAVALADGLHARGDTATASALFEQARAISRAVRLEGLFTPAQVPRVPFDS